MRVVLPLGLLPLALMLAPALALPGCHGGAEIAAGPSASLPLAKSLYAAEAAYAGVAAAAELAVDQGLVKGATAGIVAEKLGQAHTALLLARGADRIGAAATTGRRAAEALSLVAEIEAILRAQGVER